MKKIFPDLPRVFIYADHIWNLGVAVETLNDKCSSICTFSDVKIATGFVFSQGHAIDCPIILVRKTDFSSTLFGRIIHPTSTIVSLIEAVNSQELTPVIIDPLQFLSVFDRAGEESDPLTFTDADRAIGSSVRQKYRLDLDWRYIFACAQGCIHEEG